jgi:hypothetical protein
MSYIKVYLKLFLYQCRLSTISGQKSNIQQDEIDETYHAIAIQRNINGEYTSTILMMDV